jgi:hypothetical protein
MTAKSLFRAFLAAGAGIWGLAVVASGTLSPRPQDQAAAAALEKTITVAADAGWTDAAIDVGPGEELRFSASGEIDLQRGNPQAVCGPAGLDLITTDQPVPNANLGALIGKIVQPVAMRVDGDSGMEIRDEIFVLFLVGQEATVTAPFKGRLYLGVNENVLKDNVGAYSVVVVRRPL